MGRTASRWDSKMAVAVIHCGGLWQVGHDGYVVSHMSHHHGNDDKLDRDLPPFLHTFLLFSTSLPPYLSLLPYIASVLIPRHEPTSHHHYSPHVVMNLCIDYILSSYCVHNIGGKSLYINANIYSIQTM